MIVTSNTSPIMNLAVINQLNIIEQLYGKVIIPEAVSHELSVVVPEIFNTSTIQTSHWIEKRSLKNTLLAESLKLELDSGEAEAVALAVELKATLLLIDERRGRNVASRFGLTYIGLLGILVDAKQKGIILSVKPVLDDLIAKAGFWLSNKLYTRILQETGE